MCFSSTVSFATSAALVITGIFTLKMSARHELLFASIPLLFAAQQFIEGVLWLILPQNGINPHEEYWLVQGYTVFVGIIWPILAPFSLWMIEPEPRRKKIMLVCLAAGVGIALFTVHAILQFPVTARITSYCILYEYPAPQPHSLLALYVFAICGAFFCSSNRAIVRLGWVNIAAFLVTYAFYRYDLASVWCFFAAVISGLIYLYCDERAKYRQQHHMPVKAML